MTENQSLIIIFFNITLIMVVYEFFSFMEI